MPDCCEVKENLELFESTDSIKVYVCQVCGRKHREVSIEPFSLGAEFPNANT